MAKSAKKGVVASFVEGKKASKTPKPKSLTPKVQPGKSKSRGGKYSKSL